MDRVHLDVLIRLVELDAAGHAGKILCGRHDVADRLRVLAAAANHVGDDANLIEGVRIIKKHLRKSQDNPQGKIAEREGPIHISNVKLVEKKAEKKTKTKSKAKAEPEKKAA